MSAEGPHIRTLSSPDDPAWSALPALFRAMHAELAASGLVLPLVDGGEEIWAQGVRRGVERFGRTVVLEDRDRVHGFAHGALKMAPDHLGGVLLGQVTHVHVDPASRRHGWAGRMFVPLQEWFRSRQVTRIELQVVADNDAAMVFWRGQGFQADLVQMFREP